MVLNTIEQKVSSMLDKNNKYHDFIERLVKRRPIRSRRRKKLSVLCHGERYQMSTDSIKTDSGIPVKGLYSRKIASKNADNEEPGKFPYTRGLYPNMYRERLGL